MRALVSAALLLASCGCDERSSQASLPDIARLPQFVMTDQRGEEFGLQHLHGKVWIANFIFTSCPDVCPMLTQKMRSLQTRLQPKSDGLYFVSFSIDPKNDTPERLRQYAETHRADGSTWRFLTGTQQQIQDVIVDGFKQAVKPEPREEGKPFNILHGSHFVLVDRTGTIRGFFRSDEEGLDELAQHALELATGHAS